MTTFTKERLREIAVEKVKKLERVITQSAFNAIREDLEEELELARIALASLEAVPVAYVDPHVFHNFSVFRAGETDNKRMGREWMRASPDTGLVPVYTAPPAPVLPEEPLSAMEEVLRISDRDHEAWHQARAGIVACRTAMQGKAEPVSQPYKLPDGWVACSERMPEEGGRYLAWVTQQNSLGLSAWAENVGYQPDDAGFRFNGRVTHWMPLPAAPEA